MENIYKHIATTLKDLRQKKGWSLDKAALATGVSKAMLGQIERIEIKLLNDDLGLNFYPDGSKLYKST